MFGICFSNTYVIRVELQYVCDQGVQRPETPYSRQRPKAAQAGAAEGGGQEGREITNSTSPFVVHPNSADKIKKTRRGRSIRVGLLITPVNLAQLLVARGVKGGCTPLASFCPLAANERKLGFCKR